MTKQFLCHARTALMLLGACALCSISGPARGDPQKHDYPTHVLVEYVHECIAKNGGSFSNLYKCSCVMDRISGELSYDDFVEASTFVKYARLPGEGGAIFRDSERAKKMAKLYRELERDAYQACGLAS